MMINKNTTIKFIIILIGICSLENAFSQIEKSNEQIFILGKKYYLHKVTSGHTLYSISKAYNISQQEIIIENSALQNGLKSGMELKIPAKTVVTQDIKSNEKFIFHTVKKKQTLYFITKKYNVTEGELLQNNPILKDGLKTGQIIKIPEIIPNTVSSDSEFYFHKVETGETIFSLAQKYKTNMEILKKVNPELFKGLKNGQIIKIPKSDFSTNETLIIDHNKKSFSDYNYDPQYFEEAGSMPCNNFVYTNNIKFKIAVLLPLYIEENNAIKTTGKYYKRTERFYEFYQGLLISANKLKQNGISIEFIVRDTKGLSNNLRIKNILNEPEVLNADLIIGPIHSENFKIASNIAKLHKINIVAPLELKYSNLVNTNPFIFLSSPNVNAKIDKISKHLANSYDKSIIVIHNGTVEEQKLIEIYKNKLVNTFASYDHINEIVFKQVNFKASGTNGVEDALSIGLGNIIIIPSSDRVFITNLITKLNYLSDKYKITAYGMLSWENFRNVEVEYLKNLNFHYGTNSFIDYENKAVKNFIHSYRTFFASEPTLYSFLGYDITWYFTNIMKKYGKHFQFCMSASNNFSFNKGLRYDFEFRRVSPFSGFENKWLDIIKVDKNYNLTKVK